MKNIKKILFLFLFSFIFGGGLIVLNACGEVNTTPSISVTFYANDERVALQIIRANDAIRLPSYNAKDGYYAEGWYFDNNTFQEPFNKDSLNLYITDGYSQINVYAKVTPITYNITYENVEDVNISSLPKTYTIESETFTIPDVTKDYYDFDGWYESSNQVLEIPKGSIGDRTLVAKFKAIDYQIKYESVEGATNPNPTTYNVESNEIVLQEASKDGYKFEGWYNGSSKVSSIPTSSHGEIVLEAKWSLVNYNIIYENTLKADTSSFPKTFTIESPEITLPTEVVNQCREFTGWTSDGQTITSIASGTTHDVTVVANYNVNHTIVNDKGKKETCTTSGLTDGTHCSVCQEVIIPQKEIPATGHDYVATWTWDGYTNASVKLVCNHDSSHVETLEGSITQEKVEPTCAEKGSITYNAVVNFDGKTYSDSKVTTLNTIPHKFVKIDNDKNNHKCSMCQQLFAHDDKNYDGTCDSCLLFLEEVRKVSNLNQLLEINNNLAGAYVLTSNITLDNTANNWPGIGAQNKPFTGKLYGDGHSITGLNFNVSHGASVLQYALIINNQGLIDGLTLVDLTISLNHDSSSAAGFALTNSGTIRNCRVLGTTKVLIYNGWSYLEDARLEATFKAGLICGENKGQIIGCDVEGSLQLDVTSYCHAQHSGFIPSLSYDSYVIVNFTYGAIAYKNSGTISNCNVKNEAKLRVNASAEQKNGVDGSHAIINYTGGNFVGENTSSGVIKDSSSKAYEKECSAEGGKESNCTAEYHLTEANMYQGIFGIQNGKTDGFTNL